MQLETPALSGDDYRVLKEIGEAHKAVRAELAKRIVGQDEVVEQVLTAFFAGGHVLLLGVPGLAKTLLIRTLSDILGLKFSRIQFTPDLMPSDITGSDVLVGDGEDRGFQFIGGPIFANFVLADEINRTPPKTQSALLEAMEEYTVTAAGKTYQLPRPYFVMATQNPIEQEGTYSLPAAALDRFLFTVVVDYPTQNDEFDMLFRTTAGKDLPVERLLDETRVRRMLDVVRKVHMSEETLKYAVALVRASRPEASSSEQIKDMVDCGGSPRATQALIMGAKARAALEGRDEALPRDMRAIALPAMHHRILTNFHAEADNITSRDIVRQLIATVPRPAGDVADEAPQSGMTLWERIVELVVGKRRARGSAGKLELARERTGAIGQAAPLGARFVAYLIDALLLTLLSIPVVVARLVIPITSGSAGIGFMLVLLAFQLLTIGAMFYYHVIAVAKNGGTYGMSMRELAIVDEHGYTLSVGRAAWRWLSLIICSCAGPFAAIPALLTERRTTLWDMMSGTYVIESRHARKRDPDRRVELAAER